LFKILFHLNMVT